MAPPSRPTLADIARKSGVGVATVDRVLNRRAPVKAATAQRVLDAAEALGFHATALLKRRLETAQERTLVFLLQKRSHSFYQALGQECARATRAAAAIRGRPVVHYLEDLSPGTVANRLLEVGAGADAVALVAADHPKVADAIDTLRTRGVPVFTLLSDLGTPARAGFIGIDHRKAGRTAAWAVARLARQPGQVGIFVGSHRYLGHELSEMSFRSYMREHAPAFYMLESLANFEDNHFAHETTLDLIRRNPELVGLYVAGGGVEGVIDALRDSGAYRRIVVVCNELTPETRAALIDGVVDLVIATPVSLLADRAVERMIEAVREGERSLAQQSLLAFDLYLPENI
jgi:LacI family transcriptional regulator